MTCSTLLTLGVSLAALLADGRIANAQELANGAIFPLESHFETPLAAPLEPRFSLSLFRTNLLLPPTGGERPEFDPRAVVEEYMVSVGVGGTLRPWELISREGGGLSVALQAGVFGRFRMEKTANDLVAADWLVAMPLAFRIHRFEGRFRVLHWSAHLGDEFIDSTGADRIGFGFEAVDFLGAYCLGPVRVYGGGAFVFGSELDDAEGSLPRDLSDRASVQAGAEVRWSPWVRKDFGFVAGMDWQLDDRTNWRDRINLVAGWEIRSLGHSGQLLLRHGNGPSPMGQFFLSEESFWGVELRLGL
jgi:hypothetical protein